MGAVTGPLADALNWAGISEDEFNKKLAKCNSEQERATLITNTLNGEYAAAAEEYNKLTANTQAARDATNKMEQAQAALGAAIEPVTTAWTNMKATALQWLVDTGLPALQTGWQWIKDNLPAIGVIVGGLTAAWLAFGGAQTILNAVQTAGIAIQTALNVVMNANPIGLIILAITALVAAFMILWNNCEGFRNFWIGLWEHIKTAAGAVAEWFKNAWTATLDWFKDAVAKIKEFFAKAWEGIKAVFSNSIIGNYFKAIWETIKGVFAVVKAVLSGNWAEAWEAIKGIVNTWKDFFAGVWEKIAGVFSAIGGWFSAKFTEAKDGIMSVFLNIKEKFVEVKNKIFEAFSGIKEKFVSIGDNIVGGIWDGISNGYEWIKGKITGWVGNVVDFLKSLFGIESPSKVMRDEIGKYLPQGMAVGWEDEIPNVEKQMASDIAGLTARVQSTVSAENARMSHGVGSADTGFSEMARAVGLQTAGINSLAGEFRRGTGTTRPIIIQLDKRELGRAVVDVGGTEELRIGAKLALGGAV